MNRAKREITRRFGVDLETAGRMMQAGLTSAGTLAEMPDADLRDLLGLDARQMRALRKRLGEQKYELVLQGEG